MNGIGCVPYAVTVLLTAARAGEAPPGATAPPLDCVNTGQTENGFFIVHIGNDRVRLAQCAKSWQVSKGPDGKDVRTWNGAWEWRWPFEKSLAAPAGR